MTRTAFASSVSAAAVALGLLVATPAIATTTPTVGAVQIAGWGPGDPVRVTATGFTPSTRVTVTVEAAADSTTTALTSMRTKADGSTSLPKNTHTPLTLAPGSHRLVFTQAGGVTASSAWFEIVAPDVQLWESGARVGALLDFRVDGLATGPGVVRSVTVDGVDVGRVYWRDDDEAFASRWTSVRLPPTVGPGQHTIGFRQTGPTPYAVTFALPVLAPELTAQSTRLSTYGYARFAVRNSGDDEQFTASVVSSTGQRTADMLVDTSGPGPHTFGVDLVDAVTGARFTPGGATVSVVSTWTGYPMTATLTVVGRTVESTDSGAGLLAAFDEVELVLQSDGNLVYGVGGYAPIWTSSTAGHPGTHLVVQSDGNVVLYDVNGSASWSTGTAGIGPGARFGFDSHNDLAVFAASGRQAYSTFVRGERDRVQLSANAYLFKERALRTALRSRPGDVQLRVQPDGNIVVGTTYQGVLWSTRTAGHPNAYLVLQADGNLVVHAANGAVLWANHATATGARLVAQDDGNIVEYASNGKAVWSTRTVVH